MADNLPKWRFLSLLLLLAWPVSCLTNTSMEIDIITPTPNGWHRVNPDRGLGVVIAVQNKAAGDPAQWRFDWTVIPAQDSPHRFGDSGSIGFPERTDPSYPLSTDDPFIGLTHPYLYKNTDKPSEPMPPGDYTFAWRFTIGPWCEVLTVPRSREYAATHLVHKGSFNITVAEDAAWPDLRPTGCAEVAGQVSFTAYDAAVTGWMSFDETWTCALTASVTETPEPCRATLGAEQASMVSSIMTWTALPTGTGGESTGSTNAASGLGPGALLLVLLIMLAL
ncbi:hypothetical protein OQA88_10677 [Cercophora sp. LCS_1]